MNNEEYQAIYTKTQKHHQLFADLWESYGELAKNNYALSKSNPIGKYVADILALGPFYYYVIHLDDYSLSHIAERILPIHGLNDYPAVLQNIVDLIHPDDLDFVLEAEKAAIDKMATIGLQHQLNLKFSYCFRMRVADSSYHLFRHQSIPLAKDEEGKLTTTLHIHTDIQHITRENSRIVLVQGVGERTDCCQIDLSRRGLDAPKIVLTKREREVLALLAQGLSDRQIGKQLFISDHTVRVHRRNLLRKTGSHSSGALIRRCFDLGLL